MLTGTPHRSLSAGAAVDLALDEVDRIGMRLRMEEIGPPGYPTRISHLSRDGADVAVGYGKGAGHQGIASAHFEALERYYMSARCSRRFQDDAIAILMAPEVANQQGLRDDLVIQRWAAEFPHSAAACAVYQGASSSVRYPLFLSDPHYHREPIPGDSVREYRSLLRYTSSLGTAAGANIAEAVLHGLCELIEHDGLSHALLRWFIAQIPPINLVDPQSLPPRLRRLHRDAAEAAGRQIVLVDVTSDLGVPVYVTIKSGDDTEPGLFGAGASPVGAYAAERALSELIQGTALADPKASHEAVSRLARWPALQDCMCLPIEKLPAGHTRQVPLQDSVGDVSTVESSLDTVARQLRAREVDFYVCELTPPESRIAVVATIAPGLERFSLVHLGMPVIPTGRGWGMWTAAREST